MIVLGVDPGYKNLGLALLRIEPGVVPAVLHSETMVVGNANSPMEFVRFLAPKLAELRARVGTIDGIATETPPFLKGNIRTTALLWCVGSIITTWAYLNDIPLRHASPISLKKGVCRVLEVDWDQKNMPKKRHVRLAVLKVTGTRGRTDHEDDAIFAALLTYQEVPANAV